MGDFERCADSSPFCLGMVDFDCCRVKHKFDNQENADDDFQPPVKKGKLSLAKGICPSGSMAIGNKKEAIDDLLDGIDIKDIFD